MQSKGVIKDTDAVKEAVDLILAEDITFNESDYNLARGCQDLGAAEDVDDNRSDIDLVRGGQDPNAILETLLTNWANILCNKDEGRGLMKWI